MTQTQTDAGQHPAQREIRVATVASKGRVVFFAVDSDAPDGWTLDVDRAAVVDREAMR